MLIINADDWGRSQLDTDSTLECYRKRRVSSVSAMVFMSDSNRAAQLAEKYELDVGLHLNFSEAFTSNSAPQAVISAHTRIRRFLCLNKYAQLLYNPLLTKPFELVVTAQLEEFDRLYSRIPSHIDGTSTSPSLQQSSHSTNHSYGQQGASKLFLRTW